MKILGQLRGGLKVKPRDIKCGESEWCKHPTEAANVEGCQCRTCSRSPCALSLGSLSGVRLNDILKD